MCGGSEAVERKSERMDTAYSPRLHEEELSASAERILFRVVGMWLPKIAGKNPFDGGDFGREAA